MNYLAIAQKRKRQDTPVIVLGCLAGIGEITLTQESNIIPISHKNFDGIDSIVGAKIKINQFRRPNDIDGYMQYLMNFSLFDKFQAKVRKSNVVSFNIIKKLYNICHIESEVPFKSHQRVFTIRIADGCLGDCSYCALKVANGPLQSKPFEEIVNEFCTGLSQGYFLFRLFVAEDAGAYGQDLGTDIPLLLQRLYSHEGNYKLIFDDFSPQWLIKYQADLIDIFSKNYERYIVLKFAHPIWK